MSRVLLLTALLLAAPPAASSVVDVELSIDAASNLTGTLQSMSEQSNQLTVSGNLTARVHLEEHPSHGLVASRIEIVGGNLDIQDAGWSLSGPYESLNMLVGQASLTATSPPIPATPISANSAEFALDGLTLEIVGGTLSASGSVLGSEVLVSQLFSREASRLTLSGFATIVTTPAGEGADVVLALPIEEATSLAPPLLITVFRVDGSLVLAGTGQPLGLPVSGSPLWLGAFLLASGWFASRQRQRPTERRAQNLPSRNSIGVQ